MRRWIIWLLTVFIIAFPVSAQNPPADYAIRNIRSHFTDNNQQAQVQFEVWNIGGTTSTTATATLNVISTGEEVARDEVAPLQSQEIVTVTLTFPTSMFSSDSVQSFRAAVGIGEVEAAGSANIQSNFAQITITFPDVSAEGTPTPEIISVSSTPPPDILTEFLGTIGITFNFSDRTQTAVLVGIVGALLVLVLIIVVIIRLLFHRPPDFGNWQPPYANMPFLDPNSQAGRRQQWQTHAQNASLPQNCTDGGLLARKLPLDSSGNYFSGWRVTAMRISQYDQYGRVNRSQVIASKKVVNRVNGIMRRRSKLAPEKMLRQFRSAASGLVKPLGKKLNERNVMLPLALDVRLEGKHGDVRILFELYQCQYRRWQRIDQWEPEMAVISKAIHESNAYTIYGMRAGETLKSFRQRLADDVAQTLFEMAMPSIDDQQDSKPTNPHNLPVARR